MKYNVGETYYGKLVNINDQPYDNNVSIAVDKFQHIDLNIYDLKGVGKNNLSKITVQLLNGDYLTLSSIKAIGGGYANEIINYNFYCYHSAWGPKPFDFSNKYKSISIKVTSGFELIGLFPMNKKDSIPELEFKSIGNYKIPQSYKNISAELEGGKIVFSVQNKNRFDDEHYDLSFIHDIQLYMNEPKLIEDFSEITSKIITFFGIISDEFVSMTKFEVYDNNDAYDILGYFNFPKQKLNVLSYGNGHDTTFYLRQRLIKITDFEDCSKALRTWFHIYDQIHLAVNAYQRIILDYDVNNSSTSTFLSSMQLVEGFMAANPEGMSYDEKEQDFKTKKSEIMLMIENEEDQNFINKYCTYMGETFRKKLTDFTYKVLILIEPMSKSACKNNYKELFENIKNDRDTLTHSSIVTHLELNENDLTNIAYLYSCFYRILILAQMGLSKEKILHRFSYNRDFIFYIEKYFQIKIVSPDECCEFDMAMKIFSHEPNFFDKFN